MNAQWKAEDGVALREFLRRVPQAKLKAIMHEKCPVDITAEIIMKSDADAVARLAAMKAGWDAYGEALFALANPPSSAEAQPGFRDMS